MSGGALSDVLIEEAAEYLRRRIRRTPVEPSPALSEMVGAPVWLKLEFLQLTGSFKIRGAYFSLSKLNAVQKARGVVTCSAGNHGKAVAYACRQMGISARIYVPSTVDEAKYQGMLELEAEVVRTEHEGYDECDEYAQREAAEMGMTFLSPFDDWNVMAGNGGSLACEVLEQTPNARSFLLPVGGGGLAAGFARYLEEECPRAYLMACQLAASPALQLSLHRGQAVTRLPGAETVAGGLEGGLGRRTFSVLKERVDEVALIEEDDLGPAMQWMIDHHQYLIEPSAAVTLAAVLCGRIGLPAQPTVIVLSGRNVALPTLRGLLEAESLESHPVRALI
ncbi:MAG TPA: pyridoxal-phosphate dependent enzyme [Acidobacteriota bacterium]|nr:pyridoxal-phosphate dependent enzyme [Acidobacteriota bacterium]